jgi:hypothetical protein
VASGHCEGSVCEPHGAYDEGRDHQHKKPKR